LVAKLDYDFTEVFRGGDADAPLFDVPPGMEHAAIPVRHFAGKETAEPFAAVCK
jgi:hypothetical protein